MTVEEPKPCVDLSMCYDSSPSPWLKNEVVVENADLAWTLPPDVDLPWLADGGGTQTLRRPVHLPWPFPALTA